MNTGEKASKLIEDRLKELEAEERTLRRALSHLGEGGPPGGWRGAGGDASGAASGGDSCWRS